ncbi:uncharacterized protein LOC125494202 [Beta vulgaris subsp. vulgaris]|uniref:uncharacterized protein LOC125494202 n=1 Tax=Beta vulgaris subsp. vulgaris TaxID=3555 RepID=UPI002036D92D|nr:uncharacterized protein LOC125494202 [Beta vulgaris subsp. vulgaris]
MNKIVLPVATSGIAAANIVTGRTAHSRFKIPLDHTVSKQSGLAALLKETSLIIWDESSMARKENIESLDLLLRDLCDPNVSFGGKVVVFGGDFRQVLPVVPQKTQNEVVEASLVSSTLWPTLTHFSLTENMRAREDQPFSEFLLDLGNGSLQTAEIASVQVPPEIVMPFDTNSNGVDELVRSVFPEISVGPFSDDFFTDRAILTPMKEDVDGLNNDLITKFPGDPVVYKSFDMLIDDACNMCPTEFLNTLCPGGMSPHELVLKENSPVILLRNLAPAAGLCNGTRLYTPLFTHVLEAFTLCYTYYATRDFPDSPVIPTALLFHLLLGSKVKKQDLSMKPEKTYLDKLTPTTKAYKVKVKLKEKSRTLVSPQKKTRYQQLLFEDEKVIALVYTAFCYI